MKVVGTIKLPNGAKLNVVDKINWDGGAVIVCGDTSFFDDDKKGRCNRCDKPIVYRWYQPDDVEKICIECVAKTYESE